jgi:Tfp pilus assembly protein PilF
MHTSQACLLVALVAVLGPVGCQMPAHSTAEQQAQDHWKKVRAGVKLQLAGQQFSGGNPEAAIATAAEVVALDPDRAEGYLILARSYLELGRLPEAEETIQLAEMRGRCSADLKYTRGVLLERRDRHEAALEAFRAARHQDSTEIDYLVAEVECLVTLDRLADAESVVADQRDRLGADPVLSLLSGQLAALRGDDQAALVWLGQAATAMPQDLHCAEAYGLALTRAGRYAEAVRVLAPLAAAENAGSSSSVAGQRALAICEMRLGRAADACRTLSRCLTQHPGDAATLVLLARASLMVDDEMTALRSLHLAQQTAPADPELWITRAAIQWKRREYVAAESSLQRVLEARPDDVEALCLMGEVQKALGQTESADARFRRALELDPQCGWAASAVARGG